MDLGADIRPAPFTGQLDACQDPCLDLIPRVGGQKLIGDSEFRFDFVESVTPSFPTITINAKDKDICHRIETHNLRNPVRFQCFINAAEQRLLANLNLCAAPADGAEKPLENRLQYVLILAKIFGDDEDVRCPPSTGSPSVKASTVSSQPPVRRRPSPWDFRNSPARGSSATGRMMALSASSRRQTTEVFLNVPWQKAPVPVQKQFPIAGPQKMKVSTF